MSITGILSISNATNLGYPFTTVIKNLSKFCDGVLVGVDPTYLEDYKAILALNLPNIKCVDRVWNREKLSAGREIAIQMDALVELAKASGSDWVVVMQADEVLHENTFSDLHYMLENAASYITGFSMERLYFWKDLITVRKDWSARLVRVFRPDAYSFLADNTDKAGMYSGQTRFGMEIGLDAPHFIYHYSRVDDALVISKRIRNLDTFFHGEETLVAEKDLTDYDFKARQFDNYSIVESPPEVEGSFETFEGTHPQVMLENYGVL
jgi:hypothetical protein